MRFLAMHLCLLRWTIMRRMEISFLNAWIIMQCIDKSFRNAWVVVVMDYNAAHREIFSRYC